MEDVLFENVHIKIAAWSNYSQGSADGTSAGLWTGLAPALWGWPVGGYLVEIICQRSVFSAIPYIALSH